MLITYIKLKRFKRFPLSDIEIFEHDFSNKLVGIIGQNGSGKSSLLRELSPLPANKENFYSDGYKEIHITKSGKEYKLISDFTTTAKYYFICDGEELNNSNLISIQKELVMKHFSLTDEIFEILIGLNNFTTLTAIQRKKLFNNITHINIDALIDRYEKYKTELKLQESVLKIQTNSFTSEQEKLLNPEKYESLLKEKITINEELNLLIDIKSFLIKTRIESCKDIDVNYDEFIKLNSLIKDFISSNYTYITSYPQDSLDELKELFTKDKNSIEIELSKLYYRLNLLLKDLDNLDKNSGRNVEEIQKQIDDTTERNRRINTNLDFIKYHDGMDVSSIKSCFERLDSRLNDTLTTLESNENKKYTKDKHESLDTLKTSLTAEIKDISNSLNKLLGKKEEIENVKTKLGVETQCPSCNHKFFPLLNGKYDEIIDKQISAYEEKLTSKNKELKNTTDELNQSSEYFTKLKVIQELSTTTRELKFFWDYVKSSNLIFTDPKRVDGLIKQSIDELNACLTIEENNKTIASLRGMLKTARNATELTKEEINNEVSLLDLEIHLHISRKDELLKQLKDIEISRKVHTRLNDLYNLRDKLYLATQDSISNSVIDNLLESYSSEITKCKLKLLDVETSLTSYDRTTNILEKYQADINETKETIFVLNCLISELSPKNGLIAKIVGNYLNNIIAFLNSVIQSVMEYKLEIELINLEENILDYKFRFKVENKITVSDISKASSGMKEVIDNSFKLVFYKLLGLENYPLYLDEFGVRLDTQHKTKIHNLIFKFINGGEFSQIFLITHTDNGFLSHKDAEVINLS